VSVVDVHFAVDGPSDAPVVVLSPSLGTTLHMWDPQVARLRDRYRVVRYDHRGHGKSPVPNGPYRIGDLGGDLVRLLDTLGVEAAHVCGLSLGGMTGMWVAAHEPGRVQSLVLCCTSPHLDPAAWVQRAAAVRSGGTISVADTVVDRWFTPPWAAAHPEAVDRVRQMIVASPDDGYAACCDAIRTLDLRDDLPAIRARTLVVAGADDLATPPEHGRAIAGRIPDARLEILSSAAHLANVEQAETVTELLLDHLSDEGAR
jgi:3-oxoadipate enol-lactonase